jgi:hypothetical protein
MAKAKRRPLTHLHLISPNLDPDASPGWNRRAGSHVRKDVGSAKLCGSSERAYITAFIAEPWLLKSKMLIPPERKIQVIRTALVMIGTAKDTPGFC